MPLVSIIIVTYNRHKKLLRCISSINKSKFKDFEVIVINDKPNDNLEHLLKNFNLTLINHKKEKLWVKSRNEGAKLSKGQLLLFIDDDNIISPHTVGLLAQKYMQLQNNARVGLLGPLMYNKDKTLWFWRARWNQINPYPIPVNKKEITSKELIETDTIPNAYLISKKLYFDVGMEDTNFLHNEDTELTQRLKKYGHKSYIYTKAKLVHDHGGIISHLTPFRVYNVIKSNIMLEKNYVTRYRYALFLTLYLPINMLLYYFIYKIPLKINGNRLAYYKRISMD